jgi:hypothetical protein
MTLTETAINWLEEERVKIGANSLSDTIERMARNREKLLKMSSGE